METFEKLPYINSIISLSNELKGYMIIRNLFQRIREKC